MAEAKKSVVKKPVKKASKTATNKIKVTYVKSAIGFNKKQRLVLESLGLNKLNSSNILPDNPAVRGMVFKVKHLVSVEENIK